MCPTANDRYNDVKYMAIACTAQLGAARLVTPSMERWWKLERYFQFWGHFLDVPCVFNEFDRYRDIGNEFLYHASMFFGDMFV